MTAHDAPRFNRTWPWLAEIDVDQPAKIDKCAITSKRIAYAGT
uniref:Uncharacterized protein n=1 Tax=Verrucosispora sp. MS100047 TaxID=1410949 RepID=A0A097CTA5_9ACTN|nr:hypothetical protein VASRM7_627 [Verrucosispora sp. MS100047]